MAFAEYFISVFRTFPFQLSVMEEEVVSNDLNAPQQTASPMKKMRINKVKNIIQYKINPKKALDYDLITGKVLKGFSQGKLSEQ
jgi:hypothetical protein